MNLTEKEKTTIQDLKTQEQSCVEKYDKYSKQAEDPVLQKLFETIRQDEQKHLDSLTEILQGKTPNLDLDEEKGKEYEPTATYSNLTNSEAKKHDCFLATDCIGTEKMVSGEYNSDVFVFGDAEMRKLLANIQRDEQNHAEMLWKYKQANCMA